VIPDQFEQDGDDLPAGRPRGGVFEKAAPGADLCLPSLRGRVHVDEDRTDPLAGDRSLGNEVKEWIMDTNSENLRELLVRHPQVPGVDEVLDRVLQGPMP